MSAPWLDWGGCALGLLGAFLLATNTRLSRWGWVAFLISNVAWILYAIATGAWALLIQQAGFTVTSLIGLRQWFRPKALAPDLPGSAGTTRVVSTGR